MKIPQKPPDWRPESIAALQPSAVAALFRAGSELLAAGRYLHWDELRRRPAPEGLTHEQWWTGAKLARLTPRVEVPLLDLRGSAFSFTLTTQVHERLHEIDLGLGGAISMPAELANPEQKDRYYVSSLIEEAITSSQLEGATTTRRIAADMLRAGREPRDRSERMILNNYLTMKRIGGLKAERLTPELVFELHRLATSRTLDDETAAGRLRSGAERVAVIDEYGEVFHEPPPAAELATRMQAMCAFANGDTPGGFLHPAIRAIVLHFWLAYDHPFVDGSGRTARALFYWAMLHSRYWLFEFISISHIILRAPSRYYRAFLHTETDEGDLTYFILYHLDVIHRAIQALHEYIARKASELERLRSELAHMDELNHRQRALISHALRRPGTRYTVESHRASHDVVYETARSDLLNLVERGLLEKHKSGKKLVFTAAKELQAKLAT
ncbi:MAG TPA: Fic family protein [Polyangiales bacterium]|nr:Fic family protein [Polyangiales bacterium]